MSGAGGTATEDPIDALETAAADLEAAREEVEAPDTVAAVADLRADLEALFDQYEDRATDWDDLEGYAEFRTELGHLVEDLGDDLPDRTRGAVEAADDALVTGGVAETLSASDFREAREALSVLEEYADRRDRLEHARERYRECRRAVADRRDALADRVADLEWIASFADATLDADLDPLREPIEAYNRAVGADIEDLRRDTPAREALSVLASAADRPLVDVDLPPEDLHAFVRDAPGGEKPLATLAEWAGYSPSKLDHYAENADAFRRHVTTHRTYLEGLSADPFEVAWPPPPADELRWRCRGLEPAIRRFAREETVARLRAVRRLSRDPGYTGVRRAAVAREELDPEARGLIRDGRVEEELATAREQLDRIERALDEHPPIGTL